jgi:fermentation-respiration switch protein FrsA (DUF1100 family)
MNRPAGTLIATLFLVAAAAATTAVVWAGHVLTRPARAAIGAPPPALAASRLAFPSASGALIGAWFVQGEPRAGAVLLLHGIRSDRRTMAARARFLKALGLSILMIDLQAHGESTGERITFGHREARDVEAALRRLAQLAPGERIGVLGVSLGAAAAVFADARPQYAAVVLESLYPTIDEAVAGRLRLYLGPVGPWLAPLLLMQLNPRLGVQPAQLRPIDRIGDIVAPILFVHGGEDRHTTLAEARRLYEAARAPKTLYVVEGAAHVDLHADAGVQYEARVGAFLLSHLRTLSVVPTLISMRD